MAKYDDGDKYDDGEIYDASLVDPGTTADLVRRIVMIDWDGTGFTGESETDYNALLMWRITRGRQHLISSGGMMFEPMQAGMAELVFDNANRRYDPFYASGPLYGKIEPGRNIKLMVMDNSSGTVYQLFAGRIADIQPDYANHTVTITAQDALGQGTSVTVDLPVRTYNPSYGTFDPNVPSTHGNSISRRIADVVERIGLSSARIYPYAQPVGVFAVQGETASQVLLDLANASLGQFFIAANGLPVYYPPNYTGQTTHTIGEAQVLKEVILRMPWESLRNVIELTVNKRGIRRSSAIWTLPGETAFERGETITWDCKFGAPATNVGRPQAGLNYRAVADTGADVSGSFYAALSEVTSMGCRLTVTNNSGGAATLRWLKIPGSKIEVIQTVKRATDTADNIKLRGERMLRMDNQWLQDNNYAAKWATVLLTMLKSPLIMPVIQFEARPSLQFSLELFDKTNFTSSSYDLDDTWWIGGLEHQWRSGEGDRTVVYLQYIPQCTDAIDDDEYDVPILPDEDDEPDEPPPGDDDGYDPNDTPEPPVAPPDPPPPNWSECYTSTAAPANGPYTLSPDKTVIRTSDSWPYIVMRYNCIIRPGAAQYKSKLVLSMSVESVDSAGNRNAITTNDDWWCYAIDDAGALVCSGTISNVAGYPGLREVTFAPATYKLAAAFVIFLNPLSGTSKGYWATGITAYEVGSGSWSSPASNVIGETDGQYASYTITGASGSGMIDCVFDRSFQAGTKTVTLNGFSGSDGTYYYGLFQDGVFVAYGGVHATSGAHTEAFNTVRIYLDPAPSGTCSVDSCKVTTTGETIVLTLRSAKAYNVCGVS